MKLRVSQECINGAIEALKDPRSWLARICPVALAFKECGYDQVMVRNETFSLDGKLFNIKTESLRKYIYGFTEFKTAKPRNFIINIPKWEKST